jgi:uncharacterized protein
MNPSLPFTDADLDRLEELLDSPLFKGEALQLDELQALICAVVSGPELIPPSVWLPAALGDQPDFASEAQTNEVIGLVMRFYNVVAEELMEGDDWELILYPSADDADELDFGAWADAYIYGSQLGCDWFEAAGEHAEDLSDLLQPFFLLNGMLKEDAEKYREPWMTAAQEKHAIESAREDLPELVSSIFDFWRAKQQSGKTVRRDAPKAGRNDACPCGSGKKYKQCCGSPEKLH